MRETLVSIYNYSLQSSKSNNVVMQTIRRKLLEPVKKLLTQAKVCAVRRAGGEESEEYPRYFELSEPFPAQPATRSCSRQEFLNKL